MIEYFLSANSMPKFLTFLQQGPKHLSNSTEDTAPLYGSGPSKGRLLLERPKWYFGELPSLKPTVRPWKLHSWKKRSDSYWKTIIFGGCLSFKKCIFLAVINTFPSLKHFNALNLIRSIFQYVKTDSSMKTLIADIKHIGIVSCCVFSPECCM